MRCDDADSAVASFYDIVYEAFNQYVPVQHVYNRFEFKNRYPFKVRKLLGKKAIAWQVYRKFRTEQSLNAYKLIAAQCRLAIRNFHADLETKIISSANTNQFYRYANRKFVKRTPMGPLKLPDATLVTDPAEKAELLQSVFSSLFTVDNGRVPSLLASANRSDGMSSVNFTANLVKRAIERLRVKSKGGPDGLPPIFFKICESQLSSPLAYIYSLCFQQGYLAPDWLRAYITPVFKKSDSTNPLNYRPIALTCTVCKIMERIINDQLLAYLLRYNFITKHQHAFLKNRSTATNLLECTEDWMVALTSHHSADVIYIDFSRAFDSVVFTKLIAKLEHYDITGRLLTWISAFLHNRTQCVVLENCFSTVTDVKSGVVQGSVLGPILFLIFINDVTSVCNNDVKIKLFADDVKLYSIINIANCNIGLQQSLGRLASWASSWQFSINISKCNVLSLHNRLHSSSIAYNINGTHLANLSQVSDLGVLIDAKLVYNQHISNVIAKATQRAGVFFRGFTTRRLPLMRKTFTTYIRPILEYASIIWNPTKKYLIGKLENVQRRYTKRISSLAHLPYQERLATLNLEPLEIRRLRLDLIQYYKIFHNLSCIPIDQYFELHQASRCLRNSTTVPIINKPLAPTNLLASSFFYRCIDCWNSLPPSITSSSSINAFRNAISKVDLSRFLKGSIFNDV
jgi:hypothetical protein